MSDIATIWVPTAAHGDWAVDDGQLVTGQDLETAVLISLFSDGLAAADDVITDGSGDRRGWWADTGSARPVGSRLWLLDRSKQTAQVLAAAHDYIAEALQWLIDDGVVAEVSVATEWTRPGLLGARVLLLRQDGAVLALNYSWAWSSV